MIAQKIKIQDLAVGHSPNLTLSQAQRQAVQGAGAGRISWWRGARGDDAHGRGPGEAGIVGRPGPDGCDGVVRGPGGVVVDWD